jgi:vacuolar protein 8
VQTIVQLLEAKDAQLTNNIRNSTILISSIRQLAESAPSPQHGAIRDGRGSDDDFDEDGMFEDGEGEIYSLAKRILELVDSDDAEVKPDSALSGEESAGEQSEDHAALRASVHQALRGQ